MSAGFSPAHAELEDGLGQLCRRWITPEYVAACDADARYPDEAMEALAAAGWAALAVPAEHGGAGASATDLAVVHMVLARSALAVGQAYFSLWVLGADAIARLGDADQRARWLPRVATGEARVAFAMTEPGAGSDAAAVTTSAERTADGWLVSGQKVFITGASVADTVITLVRTTREGDRHAGLSLLMIDPRARGVTVRKLSKVGLRSLDLCEVFLDRVEVPSADVLGPEDGAWRAMRAGLALERTLLGAVCVGAMADLVTLSTGHAREREAFGRAIGSFQMIGRKIVDMRVAMDAARLLVFDAAATIDRGEPAVEPASVAKLFASEAYVSAAREAVQVYGGYGFTEEFAVGRHYRDAKYMEIGGGSSEIQRVIIGRSMGLM